MCTLCGTCVYGVLCMYTRYMGECIPTIVGYVEVVVGMSKAMQYIMALLFTLSTLMVDYYVGGWWYSTVFFAVLITIPCVGIIEFICRKVDEHQWTMVDRYTQHFGLTKAEGMAFVDRLMDGWEASTPDPYGCIYNWEVESFHTLDEELIYQGECMLEQDRENAWFDLL